MVAERLIAPSEAGRLHAWLAGHRGPDAEAAMDLDPRYVFFRLIPTTAPSRRARPARR